MSKQQCTQTLLCRYHQTNTLVNTLPEEDIPFLSYENKTCLSKMPKKKSCYILATLESFYSQIEIVLEKTVSSGHLHKYEPYVPLVLLLFVKIFNSHTTIIINIEVYCNTSFPPD